MQAKVTSPSGSDAGKHARSRLMMTDSQNHMRVAVKWSNKTRHGSGTTQNNNNVAKLAP